MPSLLRMLPQCPPRIQHQPEVHHSPRRCCQRPTWKSLDTNNALAHVTTVRTCHPSLVASKVRHHRERKCHCCAVPGRPGKFHTQMQPCRAHFALQKSPLPNLHPPMSQQIRPQSMHFNLNEDTKLKRTGMTNKMSAKSDAVVSKWLLWSLQKHHMCCKSEKHAFVSCHGTMQRKQHDYLEKRKTC